MVRKHTNTFSYSPCFFQSPLTLPPKNATVKDHPKPVLPPPHGAEMRGTGGGKPAVALTIYNIKESKMKIFDLAESVLNMPGLMAWWRTRNMGMGGAPQNAGQGKPDSGAKSSILGLGQADEAIALHAVVKALTDKGLVTAKQRAAFIRMVTTRLSLAECTILERTLGLDEQKRTFIETEHGTDAKGRPKKTERSHDIVMNHRGLETVVGICKLAESDEESALLLLKKLGATRTTGDVWKDQLTEGLAFLKKHGITPEVALSFMNGSQETKTVLEAEKEKTRTFLYTALGVIGLLFALIAIAIVVQN